ncbi:uncharacterized protein A1O9_02579 [Exophiala aquamarina CBS 119918]|uniref:Peptidase S1 domain-containing protein n=1 Tax=Exophiala aquamarina CBS 119918 TaxID=1182545 RepID=A0A072PZF4_9EURO|nr:uncharacterized protein A1O9_02579 [Exophiala aquamarina CBS 119918]KEF61015.1 hypothetical protein A1O9_02579 [Exophiala aquamarina CBS 119918]
MTPNTSSFWGNLAPNDQAACFDPRSKPALNFGSKKAWAVQGPLQKGWNGQILPKIIEIAGYDNVRAIIFKGLKDVSVTITWSCYLIGKHPDLQILQPTIIAKAGNEYVAKNAARYFQKLKDGSLRSLLGGFKLSYAKSTVSLCGDEEPPECERFERHKSVTQSEGRKFNLCGAHVRISVVTADSALDDNRVLKDNHATIGGVIRVDGRYYAVTVAHVFQPDATHAPSPSISSLREGGSSPRYLSQSVAGYAVALDEGHQPCIGPFTGRSRVVNEQNLFEGGNSNPIASIICNREKDWALIPITNEVFQTSNSVSSEFLPRITIRKFKDTLPGSHVIAISGVSGCHTTSFEPNASAILLPQSQKIQLTWCLRGNSLPGDCGSWVIDQRGRAYAMIVATNSQSDETVCIPLSGIMDDIQDFLSLTHLPELPLHDAWNISMANFSGEHNDSTETDDESSDVERLEIVGSHVENGDTLARDDHLHKEDSLTTDPESEKRGRPPHLSSGQTKAVRSSVLIDGKSFKIREITSADLSGVVQDQLLSDQNIYLLVETPNLDQEKDDTSVSPGHKHQQSSRKQDHMGSSEQGTHAGHVGGSDAPNQPRTAEPIKVPEEPVDPTTVAVAIASRNLDHQFEASLRDLLMEAGCDVQLARDIMKAHSEKEEEIRQSSLALPKRTVMRRGTEAKTRPSLGRARDEPNIHDRGSQLNERAMEKGTEVSSRQLEATTQRKASSFAALGGAEVERQDEDILPDRGPKLKQKRLVYDRASSHLVYA